MGMLVICVSVFEKHLFMSFAHILAGHFVSLLLSCLSSLCALDINLIRCVVCFHLILLIDSALLNVSFLCRIFLVWCNRIGLFLLYYTCLQDLIQEAILCASLLQWFPMSSVIIWWFSVLGLDPWYFMYCFLCDM